MADGGGTRSGSSHHDAHAFERAFFTMPTKCAACRKLVWGLTKKQQQGLHCSHPDCKVCLHEKCRAQFVEEHGGGRKRGGAAPPAVARQGENHIGERAEEGREEHNHNMPPMDVLVQPLMRSPHHIDAPTDPSSSRQAGDAAAEEEEEEEEEREKEEEGDSGEEGEGGVPKSQVPCKFFGSRSKNCRFGDRCQYLHDAGPRQQPLSPALVTADGARVNVLTHKTPALSFGGSGGGGYGKRCRAVWDYVAKYEDELSFSTGDTINIIEDSSQGWFTGENVRTGRTGFIPENYVMREEYIPNEVVSSGGLPGGSDNVSMFLNVERVSSWMSADGVPIPVPGEHEYLSHIGWAGEMDQTNAERILGRWYRNFLIRWDSTNCTYVLSHSFSTGQIQHIGSIYDRLFCVWVEREDESFQILPSLFHYARELRENGIIRTPCEDPEIREIQYKDALQSKDATRADSFRANFAMLEETMNNKWFFPDFSRESAEQALIARRPARSFLVRRSSQPFRWALSFLPSDFEPVIHYVIGYSAKGWQILGTDDHESYPTLSELLSATTILQGTVPLQDALDSNAGLRNHDPDPAGALEDRFVIDFDDLEIGEEVLGEGNFGLVSKGMYGGNLCVVKHLKSAGGNEVDELKKEAMILSKLRPHASIMTFYGAALTPPHYFLVTEYVERGSLDKLLADSDFTLKGADLISLACDLCSGMMMVHGSNILHLDLACRNFLVIVADSDASRKCKLRIADWGLARELSEGDGEFVSAKGCQMPLRWTEPSVFTRRSFSKESDVWAAGVAIWEMASRSRPYSDIVNSFDVKTHVEQGNRLPRPDPGAPGLRVEAAQATVTFLYELILECWDEDDRSRRPSFKELQTRLNAYRDKEGEEALNGKSDEWIVHEGNSAAFQSSRPGAYVSYADESEDEGPPEMAGDTEGQDLRSHSVNYGTRTGARDTEEYNIFDSVGELLGSGAVDASHTTGNPRPKVASSVARSGRPSDAEILAYDVNNFVRYLESLSVTASSLQKLKANEVDGSCAPDLDKETLEEMGISLVGDRLKLLKLARSLRG